MTPSLGNFIASLFAGASLLQEYLCCFFAIGGVLVFISQNDRVTRNFNLLVRISCYETSNDF
jgi:hypothetical protein